MIFVILIEKIVCFGAVTFRVKKLTQRKIKFLIDEINRKAPGKKYITNKSDVYHNEDTRSLDIIDS